MNSPKTIWLITASLLSTILIFVYIFSHLCEKNTGDEEKFLSKENLITINTLLKNESDTLKAKKLIISYLNDVIPAKNKGFHTALVNSYGLEHLPTILSNYPFKVKSFFWLTGRRIFLEVVFWSLFGLMANLMYSVTIAKEFDKSRVYEHIGKFFYTPFLVIIIYLSLNALVNAGSISLEGVGKSVIVISFILGFFTRRTIVLLGKIKDLILPVKSNSNTETENQNHETPNKPVG